MIWRQTDTRKPWFCLPCLLCLLCGGRQFSYNLAFVCLACFDKADRFQFFLLLSALHALPWQTDFNFSCFRLPCLLCHGRQISIFPAFVCLACFAVADRFQIILLLSALHALPWQPDFKSLPWQTDFNFPCFCLPCMLCRGRQIPDNLVSVCFDFQAVILYIRRAFSSVMRITSSASIPLSSAIASTT